MPSISSSDFKHLKRIVAYRLIASSQSPQHSAMFEGSGINRIRVNLDLTSSLVQDPLVEQPELGDGNSSGIEVNVKLYRGAYYRTIVLVTTLEELWSERSHQ